MDKNEIVQEAVERYRQGAVDTANSGRLRAVVSGKKKRKVNSHKTC